MFEDPTFGIYFNLFTKVDYILTNITFEGFFVLQVKRTKFKLEL